MNRGEKKDLSPAVVNGGNNSDSVVVGEDLKEIKSTDVERYETYAGGNYTPNKEV